MEISNYECRDLMQSAALLSLGIPLLGTKDRGGYLTFIFGEVERCKELERQWWDGSLTVAAPRYAESAKRLKNLVYSKR